MLSRDPSMPSFQLLSDSDDDALPRYGSPPPSKAEMKRAELNRWGFDGGDTDSSETHPTWSFRKKYPGGGYYSDPERSYEEEEDEEEDGESVTSAEIMEMSEEEFLFAEPTGDPEKLHRFKQSTRSILSLI
ncbi:unnamed protein product [Cuscuta campestris]|uniref:Uncharacterized protein n=1 Tax=Cuscuta campestris TaxID=132261 RepID=A0A484N5X6_9ASTE|nr:unnamed protein product [Cuscuta campestris]